MSSQAAATGNVVIAFNARSSTPTVIDSQGNVKGFAPNAAYAMTGSEKYINSGWLLPKVQEQDFLDPQIHLLSLFKKQEHITTYVKYIHGCLDQLL
jgi:hypothetical protein